MLTTSQRTTLATLAALIAVSDGRYIGFKDVERATGRDSFELGRDLRRLQDVGLVDVRTLVGYTLYPGAVAELAGLSCPAASRLVRDLTTKEN